jgi:glycosyltransferase involved in cell wall biosynthesis
MPLVSVLMSSYNNEKFVSEAIESVLGQTFEDFELIIIENGSKDGSPQIIKDYSKKDDRIRIIFHAENIGIAKSQNELIENAKGKFICRIDSDDVWVKDKLEKQLEIMKQDENLVIWTEAELIDAESHSRGKTFTQMYKSLKKSGFIFDELLVGNYIFCSSMMFKRENLEGIRYKENIKFANDHQFNLDLAYKYKYYFIPEPLTKYRIHGSNTIFSDWGELCKDSMRLGKYITHEYGDELSSNENKKRLFHLVFTTPVYSAFKQDPWNKLNLIYGIILPFYAITLLIKNYFHNGLTKIK